MPDILDSPFSVPPRSDPAGAAFPVLRDQAIALRWQDPWLWPLLLVSWFAFLVAFFASLQ